MWAALYSSLRFSVCYPITTHKHQISHFSFFLQMQTGVTLQCSQRFCWSGNTAHFEDGSGPVDPSHDAPVFPESSGGWHNNNSSWYSLEQGVLHIYTFIIPDFNTFSDLIKLRADWLHNIGEIINIPYLNQDFHGIYQCKQKLTNVQTWVIPQSSFL